MVKFPTSEPSAEDRPAQAAEDALDAFGSEHSPADLRRFAPRPSRARMMLTGLAVLIVLTSGVVAQKWRGAQVEAATAWLTIQSNPAGAEVYLAGTPQGKTPLTLSVAPGTLTLDVVHGERRKSLTATATPGGAVVHHVELPEPAPVPEPLPPSVAAPDPARDAGRARPEPAAPLPGWLSVTSPVPLQVLEQGAVIGTSGTKIQLSAGRHELRLVNTALGFSERRVVRVTAGGRSSVSVSLPRAPLSINAVPWAEVRLNGRKLGETPIGNHPVSIGRHELVFVHPEFGERRITATVTVRGPNRVSVDMRRRR